MILEPFSTLSNAAYLVAGLLVLSISPVACLALTALGVASAGYHGTLDRGWQAADEIAMYGVFITLILLLALPSATPWWALSIGVGVLTGGVGWFHRDFDSHRMIPFLFGLLASFHLINGGSQVYLILFGLGGICWLLGHRQTNLLYEDLLHAAWHLLTAAGFAALILI